MSGTVTNRAVSVISPARLVRLMTLAIESCHLDLSGRAVLTEAATGAYVVTPILAAMAGASKVTAVTRESRYGSVAEVVSQTEEAARLAGVADRIEVTVQRREQDFRDADIVTNSGHLRPLDETVIDWLKPTAVIPLMFESWEVQSGRIDIDIEAVRRKRIAIAGTNERHPAIDVFSYLGPVAARLLMNSGCPVYGSAIAVLCDNPFASYILGGLANNGAKATVDSTAADLFRRDVDLDAIVVALRPTGRSVLRASDLEQIAGRWPDALIAQVWGDIDRDELEGHGLTCVPSVAPPSGHMGALPSDVGPEPIVRLQAGGLKVASVLLKEPALRTPEELEFVDAF